ncbi:type II restriction enzyme [Algoriphagus alkaliphilus]|uniref:Type II restriction enzyme n=1 Tax=Algoriphagus alkaliphilus TaxID=279824 RepID=A0A1G5ZQH6_9BACT|nr:HpaII family restriction endonuclease [Algoriphagus alkaliphilus]SDA97069.1 type II restriction enzyme [Algoriphagus alkaliphilus]
MITGNKGEWSEIYALFKLLGDKNLFAGDADLKKVENLFYPIIKIIRNETGGNYEYEITGDLVVVSGGKEKLRIPVKTFSEQAVKLLSKIKGSTGAFSIPETEAFMKSVNCGTLKAKSTSKSDIRIVIHDQRINQTAELGFSIKSQLGGDSTLLNAGKTTNFVYQINGFKGSTSDIKKINAIDTRSKIKDRLEEVKKLGGKLKFLSLEQDIFKNNLVLIDSLLPNILAEVIKQFFTSNLSTISALTEEISSKNPLGYDTQFSHSFYEYKIKRFLTDVALGMMPSKVWGGLYDATGGYLIVKEDGEILCYHIYNRNQFEDYLFHNTKLETASSTRHDFGNVFSEGENLYFKLNLQIRFI